MFDADGSLMVRKRMEAIVSAAAIDADGLLVAIQLATNHEAAEWSRRLFVLDIASGEFRWDTQPPFRAAKLEFVSDILRSVDREGRTIDMDLADGSFRLTPQEHATLIAEDNPFALLESLEAEVRAAQDPISATETAWWTALLTAARDVKLARYPAWAARAMRLEGEIAERRGDVASALRLYESALEQDPRVGLKKKVIELRGRT